MRPSERRNSQRLRRCVACGLWSTSAITGAVDGGKAKRSDCRANGSTRLTALKRTRSWDGYTVHFTETCEGDTPNVITHVTTTSATLADVECTQSIQDAVNAKGFGVGEHLVDSGYVSAKLLVSSRGQGTKLVGPPRPRQGWQAHTQGAFEISRSKVNFKRRTVTCPRKKKSASWIASTTPRLTKFHVFGAD
jgi:transposase